MFLSVEPGQQRSAARRGTTQHSTAPHRTAQHNTTQHNKLGSLINSVGHCTAQSNRDLPSFFSHQSLTARTRHRCLDMPSPALIIFESFANYLCLPSPSIPDYCCCMAAGMVFPRLRRIYSAAAHPHSPRSIPRNRGIPSHHHGFAPVIN